MINNSSVIFLHICTNAFLNYFQPVSELSISDILQLQEASYYPAKWTRENLEKEDIAKWEGAGSRFGAVEFLNRPETVAVNDFHIGVANLAPWIPPWHAMYRKPVKEMYRYLIEKYLRPSAAVLRRFAVGSSVPSSGRSTPWRNPPWSRRFARDIVNGIRPSWPRA